MPWGSRQTTKRFEQSFFKLQVLVLVTLTHGAGKPLAETRRGTTEEVGRQGDGVAFVQMSLFLCSV